MDHRGWKAASLAVVVAMMPCNASAAEAFLCGSDEVVYVELEDLETAKRTNPCVASHFGLTVRDEATIPAALPKPIIPASSPIDLPFRATIVDVPPTVRPAAKRPAQPALAAVSQVASSPANDYGPVRIINASTPANIWVPPGKVLKAGDRDRAN